MRSGQLFHLVKGIKKERSKTSDNQRGEKKEKSTTPSEAPILMINQEEARTRNNIPKSPTFEGREITSFRDIMGSRTPDIGSKPSHGYHHIQMAEEDEDKTTFFAGEGVYCYQKMPVGLKNTGAMYQRLVDKVFNDQIRRNLEAYVNDMVIKSTSKEASTESINAALFVRREKRQIPTYFVSRILQGAELNYPALEKLILALVYTARRLRRYFQAYTVAILTNSPIKKALTKPKKSGRAGKWAIELEEHDIASIEEKEVLQVETKEEESWITPIYEYLLSDVSRIIQDCEKCKEQSAVKKRAEIKAMAARNAWSFSHWGVNILGPLSTAPGGLIFMAIAIEHSTKWIEAKPLTIVSARHVERTLPRNNQEETPFSLTYGSEDIILTVKSIMAKDGRGRAKEVTKRRESKEVASIEKAYYQNELQ
nr:hypothetical protein [Tanacetum cinerariifolium]